MIDTNQPLKIMDGYNHSRLTDQVLEYCTAVLTGLQCNGGSMTKTEMHDFTQLGYGSLTTVISILRYGILPAYNCTLTTSRDGLGVYTITSKPEELAKYSIFRLGDTISRLKGELNIASVWVAISRGRKDALAVAARRFFRRLDNLIQDLQDVHDDLVKATYPSRSQVKENS